MGTTRSSKPKTSKQHPRSKNWLMRRRRAAKTERDPVPVIIKKPRKIKKIALTDNSN